MTMPTEDPEPQAAHRPWEPTPYSEGIADRRYWADQDADEE